MFTKLLTKILPNEQIGWRDIGEDFIRFTLLRTPYCRIYLHRLFAPVEHPQCHDHPWTFVALLLKGGYSEYLDSKWTWRKPGSVLWRPANTRHNVVTKGVSWSIIFTGPKKRQWGFTETCEAPE